MTYLITGGMGFLGTNVVRGLIEAGERIIIYDMYTNDRLLSLLVDEKSSKQVTSVKGDITDYDRFCEICSTYKVDKIIHTAAVLGSENPLLTTKVNCDGTINVLETASRVGVKKVVLTSSIAVFGSQDRYQEEYIPDNAAHLPGNIYAASKSYVEASARYYSDKYSLDSICIRFGHIYGFGRTTGASKVIDDELFSKPALGLPGNVQYGDDIINWIYVKDAARALILASKSSNTKGRALTAGGDIRSIAEVAEIVRTLIPGSNITVSPGGLGYAYRFDLGVIREQIGYKPLWSLEQGVSETIDELRTHTHQQ